jgi:hypothetical protein
MLIVLWFLYVGFHGCWRGVSHLHLAAKAVAAAFESPLLLPLRLLSASLPAKWLAVY